MLAMYTYAIYFSVTVNILKTIELYIVNGWIEWYVNYISIKRIPKQQKQNNTYIVLGGQATAQPLSTQVLLRGPHRPGFLLSPQRPQSCESSVSLNPKAPPRLLCQEPPHSARPGLQCVDLGGSPVFRMKWEGEEEIFALAGPQDLVLGFESIWTSCMTLVSVSSAKWGNQVLP